jgi:hypothetical protein
MKHKRNECPAKGVLFKANINKNGLPIKNKASNELSILFTTVVR